MFNAALNWVTMALNLVEMFNPALNWVTMILDAPSARAVVFGVPIQGHFLVEGVLGVVIVILLSLKSYTPPNKRPLTEQNWREHPPYYSLKIHNFSQLKKSTAFSDHKYQSRLFSSGGSNWRLIVYPKGNVKDNGSGFISLYVEIDSSSLIESTPPTEVFAELRFYVYNKKENKYFIIQDVEVKRFNALKMVWGLLQVLPYDTFINPENGYIFEGDECEFGVDVIVAPPGLTNWEILSFNEKLPRPKFSWPLKNFSTLKEDAYTSNRFSMGGKQWFVKLYPKGTSEAAGEWLSIYVSLVDSETLKPDEKIFKQANVRVLDPLGSKHFAKQTSHWHKESCTNWGWVKFLSLAELRKTYLDKEDTLNVEVEFTVVSSIKYSPMI